MKKQSQIRCWIHPAIATLAVAMCTALCQAATPDIVYNFTNNLQGWSGNEQGDKSATYTWNATGSSSGGGCMQVEFDGTNALEMDPWVTLPSLLNEQQYLSVSIHMRFDPSSGTTGGGGSGGYGNLQAVLRDAGYSWDTMWYGTIYPPAGNSWVTYTFIITQPYKPAEKYLQFQFGGGSAYTAPVIAYIDNITIKAVPNPWVINAFTSSGSIAGASQYGVTVSWDSNMDAPYKNPVNGASSTITPAGSASAFGTGSGYPGLQLLQTWDPTRFQYLSFDLYLDGPSGGPALGGMQIQTADGQPYGYVWTYLAGFNFNSSMVGKWNHFDIPCAVSGITNAQGYVFQLTPGSDGGTNQVNFHIDNVQAWNPAVRPTILSLTPGAPGGVKIFVDDFGTNNQFDEEGFSSPAADNAVTDFFWLNQYPASYSFTLTNAPNATVAPGFGAHVYLANGDSLINYSSLSLWNYNQTYSGVLFNVLDYLGLRVENATGTNRGVVVTFEWKTNSPNANPPTNNQTQFYLTSLPNVNGTWTMSFSDNTHVSIVQPDGSVAGTVTLPDFLSDPGYLNNFSPAVSLVQFGVSKNDVDNTGVNNNRSLTFTHVAVENGARGVIYDDSFLVPKLTGTYAWQVAQYFKDPANRIVWSPRDTAWWLQWNSSSSGWSVQSSGNVVTNWGDAGVTYTYVDSTGTNTIGAIPGASLPPGGDVFFRLANPNP